MTTPSKPSTPTRSVTAPSRTTTAPKAPTNPQAQRAQSSIPTSALQLGNNRPQSITSLYQLIGGSVTIPAQNGQQQSTTYTSPLNSSNLSTIAPVMWDSLSTSGSLEMPARVNINTAPLSVLQALPGMSPNSGGSGGTSGGGSGGSSGGNTGNSGNTGNTSGQGANTGNSGSGNSSSSGTTDDLASLIVSMRQQNQGQSDPIYLTPAWLISQDSTNFTAQRLNSMDKYITARSTAYRVQAVGQYGPNGPTARVEAVIEVLPSLNGQPKRHRIVYYRDLTEFGKGFNVTAGNNP